MTQIGSRLKLLAAGSISGVVGVVASLLTSVIFSGCGSRIAEALHEADAQTEQAATSRNEAEGERISAEAENRSAPTRTSDPYWDIDRMYAVRTSIHEWELGKWNASNEVRARKREAESRLQLLETSRPKPPVFEQREWLSSDSQFSTEAVLVDARIDSATLRKLDGDTIEIPKVKLNEESRLYIEKAFTELTSFRESLEVWNSEREMAESELKAAELNVAEFGELKPKPTLPTREAFGEEVEARRRDRELRQQSRLEERRAAEEARAAQRRKAAEEAAAAYAAAAPERERAAAKKRLQEREVNGLVLHTESVEMRHDAFGVKISGEVENRRQKTLSFATIYFNLYDASDAQVGYATASITGLEPGGRWKFEASGTGRNVKSHKFMKITAFESR